MKVLLIILNLPMRVPGFILLTPLSVSVAPWLRPLTNLKCLYGQNSSIWDRNKQKMCQRVRGGHGTYSNRNGKKVKREISAERQQVVDQPDLLILHHKYSDPTFCLWSWTSCCLSGGQRLWDRETETVKIPHSVFICLLPPGSSRSTSFIDTDLPTATED